MKIHLIIPMSGEGQRFIDQGYTDPKPLIKVNQTPMVERLLANFPKHWPFTAILSTKHRQSPLESTLKRLRPDANILYISPHKLGPGQSLSLIREQIPQDEAIFVSYCDYSVVWDSAHFERFVQLHLPEAVVVSYRGFHPHFLDSHSYAYSKLSPEFPFRIIDIQEKRPFSENFLTEFASSGGYYFQSGKLLLEALDYQFKNDGHFAGEYYTSLTVKALFQLKKEQAKVHVFKVPHMFQWGTPLDLKFFEFWENNFLHFARTPRPTRPVFSHLIMPMAGDGTRLKNLFSEPKPLVKIGERELFLRALDSLPLCRHNHLVVKEEHRELIAEKLIDTPYQQSTLVSTPITPKGQAHSVLLALKEDLVGDILLSACDHALCLSEQKLKLITSGEFDAVVFTIQGYPATRRNPKAFSYVAVNSDGTFDSVHLKNPVSLNPLQDHLLIGSFWFKNCSLLKRGIQHLCNEKNSSKEVYLDTILNFLKNENLRVGVIAVDGYINWGDSESYQESTYWESLYTL